MKDFLEKIKKFLIKMKNFFYKMPIIFTLVISLFFSMSFCLIYIIKDPFMIYNLIQSSLAYMLFTIPLTLTIENVFFLLVSPKFDNNSYSQKKMEILGLFLGIFCTLFTIGFFEIRNVDWHVQLSNNEVHSPIFSGSRLTIMVLLLISFIGYMYCRFKDLKKQPPLATVLGISSMYLGVILSIVWCIQLKYFYFLLFVLPINYIIIILKTIRYLIYQKSQIIINEEDLNNTPKFPKLNKIISKSSNWPWLGIVLMIPLLGVIIIILLLFGQSPDSIIKAWTETADWTFSQKVAPQNIYYDQHYLCTVAAGGHQEVVKPIREGKRHGHKVLVNRQLCVANAFEQILEENLPKFHSTVRYIYDKYGYPIATKINSPYTADAIYILMKPLEWFFLIILYLVDTKPENRIAIQYPHKDLT